MLKLVHDIVIGRGVLEEVELLPRRCALISDDKVGALYGETLAKRFKAELFMFSAGEAFKTEETKNKLATALFQKGFGKDCQIVALGGGVVTDMAGYLAATFCRGVPLTLIPTSLLAMVDAAIGGKNGVNTPFGKNLMGTIYAPQKVIIDLLFLETLPEKERFLALSELIKLAIILDAPLFDYFETAKELSYEHLIYEGCRIKKEIVTIDPYEEGPRYLLNFGHTIAHAIEAASAYTIPHGEAVFIGIYLESKLSFKMGYLSAHAFQRIDALYKRYHFPYKLPLLLPPSFLLSDKKTANKTPRFVLPQEIGTPLCTTGSYLHCVCEEKLNIILS
jgi:3-dehydroquinate synthase